MFKLSFNNIDYRWDDFDEWKKPSTTFSDKFGDCEDTSALMLYIINTQFGEEQAKLKVVYIVNEELNQDGFHVFVEYKKTKVINGGVISDKEDYYKKNTITDLFDLTLEQYLVKAIK